MARKAKRSKRYLDGRAQVTIQYVKDADNIVLRAEYAASLRVDNKVIFDRIPMEGIRNTNRTILPHLIEDAACFFTLQQGNIEQEYFNRYTTDQLAWASSFDCECMSGEARN